MNKLELQKIERLYKLLERAKRENDEEMVATLKWAIFKLEECFDGRVGG